MKIKSIKKAPVLIATLAVGAMSVAHFAGDNFAKAAQKIAVESEVMSQISADVNNKNIHVDSMVYLTRYKFNIPDSAIAGDFFEVATSGVADIPQNHKFVNAQGIEVAQVAEKTCVQNTRQVQLINPAADIFDALKLQDGPAKCRP